MISENIPFALYMEQSVGLCCWYG